MLLSTLFRDPNTPNTLSSEIPMWPEFNADSSQFIQFSVSESQIVTTPNVERAEKVQSVLFTARNEQLDDGVLERPCLPPDDDESSIKPETTTISGAVGRRPSLVLLLVIFISNVVVSTKMANK